MNKGVAGRAPRHLSQQSRVTRRFQTAQNRVGVRIRVRNGLKDCVVELETNHRGQRKSGSCVLTKREEAMLNRVADRRWQAQLDVRSVDVGIPACHLLKDLGDEERVAVRRSMQS